MANENTEDEELFNNIDSSLMDYMHQVENSGDSKFLLYDEIISIDDRYCQSSIVDQGGVKKIFKTTDSLTNRPVAKAVLINCEDEEKVERFLREARLTAALEHPNIIPVYDIGVDDEGPYFIMKLIGGKNLADILKKHAADYSLQDFMSIFIKICDAVAYAHSKGVVHLDLKPANIQVGDYGEVLVCDWGLAKVLEEADEVTDSTADLDPMLYNDFTMDGVLKGTPGYMAPEQIDTKLGPKDQRTDIYALGGILYSLLTLKNPHSSDTLEITLKNTLKGNVLPPSKRTDKLVPASLEAVAMKALESETGKRYQSAVQLREEIQNWLGGFATEAENAGFLKSAWLLLNRHKLVSCLLFLLILLTAFGVYKVKKSESIALANEKTAKENEKTALENEKKTRETFELSLSQMVDNYKVHLSKFDFDTAIEQINNSLKLQPDHGQLNRLKGEVHFYRQEYAEAAAAFEISGLTKDGFEKSKKKQNYVLKPMIRLAAEYAKLKEEHGFIKAEDLFRLLDEFVGLARSRIHQFEQQKLQFENYQKLVQLPNKDILDNHMKFCQLVISKKRSEDYNFKYSFDPDGINLDFSNSDSGLNINYLQYLPLKSLNIENSERLHLGDWIFQHRHLKTLNIANCRIKRFYLDLKFSKITELTLTQEQYDSSLIKIPYKREIKFIIK